MSSSSAPPAAPPLVSIGVPVWNGERFLAQALDSALRQDYPALEIVISDNASTDGTAAIARSYAERDPRVRYHRNPENVGVGRNFQKVVTLASGPYFTWLAHDDLLSSERYLSETVGFLEEHRDVVLCGSALHTFSEEDRRAKRDRVLDALLPEREWRVARQEFFRWPQTVQHFVIYGVYRRQTLLATPLGGRRYRGRDVVTDMEFPLLASLCRHGRIVALPAVLRGYRTRHDSAGVRQHDEFSGFDHFLLALGMKATLLRAALRVEAPLPEKAELVRLTLGNFLRAPLGRRPEIWRAIGVLRREIAMLREVCDERLEAIRRMEQLLQERDDLIGSLQKQLDERPSDVLGNDR
jgi:glycosyltransferase involved in cell wall biosynthesis